MYQPRLASGCRDLVEYTVLPGIKVSGIVILSMGTCFYKLFSTLDIRGKPSLYRRSCILHGHVTGDL